MSKDLMYKDEVQRLVVDAYRALLRPGGRLCVENLTIREELLPTEILTHPTASAG